MSNKVLLFNPRAVSSRNYRIPNSILQVAAAIDGQYDWIVVDGNREEDPWPQILAYLQSSEVKYFGCTAMPGPQLRQAIPLSKRIREQFPEVPIIWGGYFASNQHKVVLESGFVDYVINGPGDHAFPALLDALETGKDVTGINNLIYKNEQGKITKTFKGKFIINTSLLIM